MEEDELRQIREARLKELQKNGGGASVAGGSGGAPKPDGKDDMRAAMLSQICTQDARERLNRVAMVKPERAQQVEQLLVQMGQMGQLRQRVGESEIVNLLNQISQREQPANKLIFSRRTTGDNDDDEEEEPFHETVSSGPAADDDDDDFFD